MSHSLNALFSGVLNGAFDLCINVVFNPLLMDPAASVALINAAGGDLEFAKLLGLGDGEGVQQRVNNWKRRGIPAAVILEHYDTIEKLKAAANGHKTRSQSGTAARTA